MGNHQLPARYWIGNQQEAFSLEALSLPPRVATASTRENAAEG
jgi:hypothetical protein